MKMTQKLADELMACLTCLALSAFGGVPVDENGEPHVPNEMMEAAIAFAKNTFIELANDIAKDVGEEWEIIPTEEEK